MHFFFIRSHSNHLRSSDLIVAICTVVFSCYLSYFHILAHKDPCSRSYLVRTICDYNNPVISVAPRVLLRVISVTGYVVVYNVFSFRRKRPQLSTKYLSMIRASNGIPIIHPSCTDLIMTCIYPDDLMISRGYKVAFS